MPKSVDTPDKVISLADLIDNMERNGFQQAYGKLMEFTDDNVPRTKGNIVAACALGQGMLNLDLMTVSTVENGPIFRQFIQRTADLNDNDRLSPDVIARKLRGEFKENLGIKLDGYYFSNKSRFSGFTLR